MDNNQIPTQSPLASQLPPQIPSSRAPQPTSPSMPITLPINEKTHPVTLLWCFKAPIIMIAISIVLYLIDFWIPYFIIAIPFFLIANPLQRASFYYSLESEFFDIKYGVLSKKQRHLPYGVIQNVFVKQDLFDRLFRLASLSVENAVQSGGARKFFGITLSLKRSNNNQESIGSFGNKVNIPGLRKQDAEELKIALLQKIKEHPNIGTQSGL